MNNYDLIVIGTGAGGFPPAEAAAQAGKSVAIVEAGAFGGECPNFACIPTKALLHAAKQYYHAKHHLKELGIHAKQVNFDFGQIMQYRQRVVETITGNGKRVKESLKQLNIDVIEGFAMFVDDHTILVEDTEYHADYFVIATGAVDFVPPIAGINEIDVWNYESAVMATHKPKSLAVIGAGPVGCELATMYGMLESEVTLFEHGSQILAREEPEMAKQVTKSFLDFGVKVQTNATVLSVQHDDGKMLITYEIGSGKKQQLHVEQVVLAAGKRANIDGLHLDRTSVRTDDRGRLELNDYLQTTADHIFAAGDVTSGMMFTHTAHYEGAVASQNLLAHMDGKKLSKQRDLSIVPRVTFTEPEVASVGLTEKEAVTLHDGVQISTFQLPSLGRSVTEAVRTGCVKIVIDKKGQILGTHIAGKHAGEVIHEAAIAMKAGLSMYDLAETIHAFPTYSEGLIAALGNIKEV